MFDRFRRATPRFTPAPMSPAFPQTSSVARAIHNTNARYGHQPMNALKLEKLVYLTHGWCLAVTGQPLIDELFLVNANGPMLASFVRLKRRFGIDDLPENAGDAIFGGACLPYADDALKIQVIERVIQRYAVYVGWKLSAITRIDDGAWEHAHRVGRDFLDTDEIRRDFVNLGQSGRKAA